MPGSPWMARTIKGALAGIVVIVVIVVIDRRKSTDPADSSDEKDRLDIA